MKKIEIRREKENRNRVIIEEDNSSYIVKILKDEDVKNIEKTIRDIIAEK